jgi:hypothetical protein
MSNSNKSSSSNNGNDLASSQSQFDSVSVEHQHTTGTPAAAVTVQTATDATRRLVCGGLAGMIAKVCSVCESLPMCMHVLKRWIRFYGQKVPKPTQKLTVTLNSLYNFSLDTPYNALAQPIRHATIHTTFYIHTITHTHTYT